MSRITAMHNEKPLLTVIQSMSETLELAEYRSSALDEYFRYRIRQLDAKVSRFPRTGPESAVLTSAGTIQAPECNARGIGTQIVYTSLLPTEPESKPLPCLPLP
jgi:hypothetical protein